MCPAADLARNKNASSDVVLLFELYQRVKAARGLTSFVESGNDVQHIMAARNADLSTIHRVATELQAELINGLQTRYYSLSGIL